MNFLIVCFDVATVLLFKHTVEKTPSDFDAKERMRCNVWLTTGIIEFCVFLIVLGLLLSQEQINFLYQFISIAIASLLLLAESVGIWDYVVFKLIKNNGSASA
jgi:hypothetical protein